MTICKVVGHVWATKKEDSLSGMKLMVVSEENVSKKNQNVFVAADVVGAGIGERVLVVSGSTARQVFGGNSTAIDAAIVGIIDSVEIDNGLLKG